MKWRLSDDSTPPVITSEKHISSRHNSGDTHLLPETCVIFEMGMALPFMESKLPTVTLYENLPCFLENPKCITIKDYTNVCFTRGGYGAPAAADTLETVRALGVKRIIAVGMCGGFADTVNVCDVIVPNKVLCEEGTSYHYYETIEFAEPDISLFDKAKTHFAGTFAVSTDATVTCDAFYRQTFAKEAFWRTRGCVGVDMESSALLSVSCYYHLPAVSILLCSDKHPTNENDTAWGWGSDCFRKKRECFVMQAVDYALQL